MSIRERLGKQVAIRDLPTWRKVVVVCGLGICLFVGWMAAAKEIEIYASAPTHSVAAKGQVYEVHVMHGSIRYVTLQEREDLVFWESRMLSWVGIPFLVAFFVSITCRKKPAES